MDGIMSKQALCGRTLEEIRNGPAVTPVAVASADLGFSKSHGFELVRRGEFPAKVITAGRRYVVVTASLVRVLEGEPA
jgi:hypothetical protein